MSPTSALLHSLRLETDAEILKALRAPEFVIPTLIFPLGFYLLFGVMLNSNNAGYLLATYGVFATMAPAIFGFGAAVATERERGWLDLKRAAPAPVYNYILAKATSTLVFSSLAICLIYLAAGHLAEVRMPMSVWLKLFAVHVFSVVPFILIGLTLGLALKSNAAVAIANLVFMVLSVLGGLWFPISAFPTSLQSIALILPSYHLGEIALAISGSGTPENLTYHWLCLAGITALLLIGTIAAWRRQG